jgi:phosphoribosylformylglycinamidine synthase
VLARPFRSAGEEIVLLGDSFDELGGSEYLKIVHGAVRGEPPRLDLARERALIALLTRGAAQGLLRSAHDCSDGGLAVTLAECAFGTGGVGFEVDLPALSTEQNRHTATLFSESASRAVVSVRSDQRTALLELAAALGVPHTVIGRTGGSRLRIAIEGQQVVDLALADAEQQWSTAIERHFAGRAA